MRPEKLQIPIIGITQDFSLISDDLKGQAASQNTQLPESIYLQDYGEHNDNLSGLTFGGYVKICCLIS